MVGKCHHADAAERPRFGQARDFLQHAGGAEIDRLAAGIAAGIDRGHQSVRNTIGQCRRDLPLREDPCSGALVQCGHDVGQRLVDRTRLAIAVGQHAVAEGEGKHGGDALRRDDRRAPGQRLLQHDRGERPRRGGIAEFASQMRFNSARSVMTTFSYPIGRLPSVARSRSVAQGLVWEDVMAMSTQRIRRRQVLASARRRRRAVGVARQGAGARRGEEAGRRDAERELLELVLSEISSPSYIPEFEQATGAKVNYETPSFPIYNQRMDIELSTKSDAHDVINVTFIYLRPLGRRRLGHAAERVHQRSEEDPGRLGRRAISCPAPPRRSRTGKGGLHAIPWIADVHMAGASRYDLIQQAGLKHARHVRSSCAAMLKAVKAQGRHPRLRGGKPLRLDLHPVPAGLRRQCVPQRAD